jgi:hypothetical protein
MLPLVIAIEGGQRRACAVPITTTRIEQGTVGTLTLCPPYNPVAAHEGAPLARTG